MKICKTEQKSNVNKVKDLKPGTVFSFEAEGHECFYMKTPDSFVGFKEGYYFGGKNGSWSDTVVRIYPDACLNPGVGVG